jgi:hypothetical protein
MAAAFALALTAQQQQVPHVGYVYPAGGRQGSNVEIRVGGQFLNGASWAYISGHGVEVSLARYVKPLTGAEAQKLRDEMQQLNEKRAASLRPPSGDAPKPVFADTDQKRMAVIREQLEEVQRRNSIPGIAEIAILQATIAPNAAPGPRELRLETAAGLTNPIVFCVGELPEFTRKPARVTPAYNVVNGGTPVNRAVPSQPEPPTEIALPATLNGQMMPGTSDRYRFRAKKGQQLTITAAARELIPYISDAVPGWFQAVLTLRDGEGKELASADHFFFHPDPLLNYQIPADGEYVLEIHDSIYRGREDFIYRITIGELPVITSIFPLGGKAGARTAIETLGWNLPAARTVERLKSKDQGVYPVTLRKDGLTSNAVPFAADDLPEAMAKAGIDRRERAQRVKLPVVVNGRIAHPGDTAFFRIAGRAGDEIVAEVKARRLGSPLDSTLRLMDPTGNSLAFNDDFEDKGAGLLTHQADSRISFTLPAKGNYYLQLADAQRKGGPEYGYRLRISHPRPDFELRVVPASLNLRAGSTAPITVYALREDGFGGDITLQLKDAAAGFALSGAAIPSGRDKVRLTVTAPRTALARPLTIELIGQARIGGHDVHRTAVPAEDMEQAFAYHHLVAESAWMVRVLGTGAGVPWRPVATPVKLPSGGAASVQIFVPPRLVAGVKMALDDPPEGISIQSVTLAGDGVSVLLRAQADKAKPGLKGNLILQAFREAAPAGAQARRRQPLGTLPAIPFEVMEPAPPRK